MPHRARELNDQPTEARIRQVIRSILDQEVRRLMIADDDLAADIATNAGDIAANLIRICNNQRRAAARHQHVQSSEGLGAGALGETDDLARRAAARGNLGSESSRQLGHGDPGRIDDLARRAAARHMLGASSSFDLRLSRDPVLTTTVVSPSTTWTIAVPEPLMDVSVWQIRLRDYGSSFNHTDFQFDTYMFNQGADGPVKDTIEIAHDIPTSYHLIDGILTIQWSGPREGRFDVYNFGSGTGYLVTAISL